MEEAKTLEKTTKEQPGSAGSALILFRNVLTVLLLFGLPLIGIVAVWTIAPWNRRARVVITILFAPLALYRPILILSALVKGAVF